MCLILETWYIIVPVGITEIIYSTGKLTNGALVTPSRSAEFCPCPWSLFHQVIGKYMEYIGYSNPLTTRPMLTSSNESISALPAGCVGNWPGTGRFPSQRPVTQSFGVFFDLRLNKRLSKQSRRRWFETPSRSLWRHSNDIVQNVVLFSNVHNEFLHESSPKQWIFSQHCIYTFPSMHP